MNQEEADVLSIRSEALGHRPRVSGTDKLRSSVRPIFREEVNEALQRTANRGRGLILLAPQAMRVQDIAGLLHKS